MDNKLISAVIPTGTTSAKVISVIETRAMKGAGISDSPLRELVQYWDFDGRLLASYDSLTGSREGG